MAGPYVYGYDGTTTAGYNITTSEMGHLYYTELGNLGGYDTSGNSQPGWGLNNTGDFQNLQAFYYWSGTESPNTGVGWVFTFYGGSQMPGAGDEGGILYAMAVRDGDVTAVPKLSRRFKMGKFHTYP